MSAGTLPLQSAPGQGIRPLDVRRDLGQIAALMDLCFGDSLDQSGRTTVREMEALSRSGPLLWLLGAVVPKWQMGFVWIENGKLVGNISTQASDYDRSTWLIANVAVHPEHRRRGIATALTEAAVRLAEQSGARRVQLQVHRHNSGAYKLYQALDFYTVTIRTTWNRAGRLGLPETALPRVHIRPAQRDEWEIAYGLAQAYRPAGFNWLRPLRQADWKPSVWRSVINFLNGAREERWLAIDQKMRQCAGAFCLETGITQADQINLVVHPSWQGQLERPLLAAALQQLGSRPWAVRVEHPADDEPAEAALKEFGFKQLQTLVWMQKDFS